MSESSRARPAAHEAIGARRLPSRLPERTWAGRGSGAACDACGEPVKPEEVEYELEFAPADASRGGSDVRRVHQRCFAAWYSERTLASPDPAAPGDAGSPALPAISDEATLAGRAREAAQKRGSP
jgi:hypothetical protein